MTIREAQQLGRKTLTQSPSAALDADCFLQFILSCDKTYLLMHCDDELTGHQQSQFNKALSLRTTGLPVAYITGHKEFYGIDFIVTPDVLIPKPDTEILVEQTLLVMQEKADAAASGAPHANHILTVCDMCTGSGCVALAVLHETVAQKMFGTHETPAFVLTDISDKALDIARQNAAYVVPEQDNIRFVRSNLFEAVTGTFDIITANPPYIPEHEAVELLKDGRREPMLALDGDVTVDGQRAWTTDGLAIMRNLVPQAVSHLAPNGVLLVEAGEYNAEDTDRIFRGCGLTHTKIVRDLSGFLRVIIGRK